MIGTSAPGQQQLTVIEIELPRCPGGPYANYQGAVFQPALAVIAYATTAVGPFTHGPGSGQGGIARAIVPRSLASGAEVPFGLSRFQRYDRFGYSDPNVPCSDDPQTPGQQRVATWIFGNANPGAETRGENPMYGWVPIKKVEGDPLPCTIPPVGP